MTLSRLAVLTNEIYYMYKLKMPVAEGYIMLSIALVLSFH